MPLTAALSDFRGKVNTMYSYKKGLLKIVKYFLIFLLPILVDKFIISFPEIAQLSVGAVLVGVVNFVKIKYKK